MISFDFTFRLVTCNSLLYIDSLLRLYLQLPDRFKFASEMERYVSEFMQACTDADTQLTVALGFSRVTCRGYPVVPSHWKVLEHMVPSALERYVKWLTEEFCNPQMDMCLDFNTHRQKGNQDTSEVQ